MAKKKVVKKETTAEAEDITEENIPEELKGKARYLGVPIEEYAQRLLASQSVTNSATEKASRIEKGLYGQGYDVEDIKNTVTEIMETLLG